jgi:hypothetical protein
MGMKGFFKMEAFQGEYVYDLEGEHICGENGVRIVHVYSGTRRITADWFPNRILDTGRNIMATSGGWAGTGSSCQVGTNSTNPDSDDTQLLGYLAGTGQIVATSDGATSEEPYFGWDQQTYRFEPGEATGNVSEAGVGWDTVDGPYLISRAKVVDLIGDPLTATVKPEEWCDVTYQLQYHPPLEDVEGTILLDGIMYDTITRASDVNSLMGNNIGSELGALISFVSNFTAYDGDIGTILQAPDGDSRNVDGTSHVNLTYQNNSYQQDMLINCGISGWNLPDLDDGFGIGIRSIRINTTAGAYQTQFNAQGDGSRIPKTIDYYMDLTWRLTWAGWYWAYSYTKQAASDATTPTTGNWNTNVAETLLRINWEDSEATDQQLELQVESDTLFRITQDSDRTKWVQYRCQQIYSEGVDYTSYVVVVEDVQNSGPDVGQACTITAVDY